MNYLSSKLSKVINSPSLSSIRRSSSVNPSSASIQFTDVLGETKTVGACNRQQYYKLKGIPIDESAIGNIDWTLSAMIGDKLHELLVQIIDTYGFSMGIQRLAAEHSIYDEATKLSGRSDLVAWDYNNNEPIGIEIKSLGETKAKYAMEQPVQEHVLQAIVYLDFYNKSIPEDQKKITKWYIWYISRTENWSIKGKDHASPFSMLWDYCIELRDNIPIVSLPNGIKQKWSQFSVTEIYRRYTELLKYVNNDVVPPRDYQISYSTEKIVGLYKADKLTRKTDKEIVKKFLEKGASGTLKISLGDIECRLCEYSDLCWNNKINNSPKSFSNLPKDKVVEDTTIKKSDIAYFL